MAIGMGTALLGSAIIGGGASILGGKSSAKSIDKASAVNLQLGRENNALATNVYNQNRETLSPYVGIGGPAAGAINSHLGLNGQPAQQDAFNQFRNSTGYQFRVGEGMNALNQGYAARGQLQSGAAMKAIQGYGQNMASDEYGKYMNYLGNQQGLGLSAASAQAGVGQNYTNTMANNNNNMASNMSNGYLAQGANTANMYAGVGNAFGQAAGFYSSYGRK